MLDGFFLSQAGPAQLLHGSSDARLVALSILIAMVSAGVCLRLADAAKATKGLTQQSALLSGSLVLGSGIWGMHFVGMLAFDLCLTVQYDLPLTLISMVPGWLASWVALKILSRPKISPLTLLVGGLCVGAGIGTMHYSGMAAMRMAPMLRYDPLWFGASLLVAVALSSLALWIRFALHNSRHVAHQWSNATIKTVSALFMGAAISGMHYTAMGAARFVGTPEMLEGPGIASVHALAMTVALAALAVIGLIGLITGLLRYRALWQRVESNEQRLQSLVDMSVDGIVTIDRHGCIQAFNRAAQEIFGWTELEALGRNVSMLMPAPLSEQHDGHLARYQSTGEGRMMGKASEVLGLHKNGRYLQLKLSLKQVDTPDALLFVGFVTDLSERRKTDARLRVAASVFEHSYEGILVLDAHFRVTESNPAYQRMSGYSQAHCRGRAMEELYSPEAFSQSFEAVRRIVVKSSHWRGELETKDANAVSAIHRMSISAVLDDMQRIQHYIVVISDVTQVKAPDPVLESRR